MFESLLSLAIRLAAAAVVLGWTLSALGGLSPRGYLLAGLPLLGLCLFSVHWRPGPGAARALLARPLGWWRRRRALPLAFLLISGLILLGSVLHEPNNFDGLNYRAPKVLHWLDQHRWHWIHAPSPALNYTLPNYEWLTVPWFLATRGFHATVVINWVAFALLPGLCFSLLRLLGAGRRLAYDWMWIFPSGYIIALEAGGIGNDLLGLTALLASLHCANRFNAAGKGGCLIDALLAAGFCTGVKISNLPLGMLVWIVLFKHPIRLLAHRAALAVGLVLSLACSALIPLLLNRIHTGSILGAPPGADQVTHPIAGWLGNTLILLQTAFAPPLLPGARQLTAWMDPQPGVGLLGWIQSHYWKFSLRIGDLPQEEGGGLGLGVTLGALLCLGLWWRARCGTAVKAATSAVSLDAWQRKAFIGWLGFALAVILARLGLGAAAPRALLPWLALVLALGLGAIGTEAVARARLWRRVAPLLSLSVVPALLITPSRPLISPAHLAWLGQKLGLSQPALRQLTVVYEVYAHRPDPFEELRQYLPADVLTLAVVSDGCESSSAFWLPYGRRRCVYWLTEEEVRAAQAQSSKPLYVLLKEDGCRGLFHLDIPGWLQKYRATPLKTLDVRLLAARDPYRFTLARIEAQAPEKK